MTHRHRARCSVLGGSLLVAGGSTLAALAAFDDRVLVVMVGFLLFIVGYAISQAGANRSESGILDDLLRLDAPAVGWHDLVRGVFLLIGWAGIALGVTLFSQTVLHPNLSTAALSGVTSITGYMAAHVGINGAGVGDSLFGPVLSRLQRRADHGGSVDE